jgi:hypothetical protein
MVKDLTGQVFGKMVVLGISKERSKQGSVVWECRCECGKVVKVPSNNLQRSGPNNSCGCARKKGDHTVGKINTFLKHLKLPGVTVMLDQEGNRTLIDTEDVLRVKTVYWRRSSSKREDKHYWVNGKGCLLLHRFIMNCPEGMVVDHVYHNLSDNRKSQLRVCSTWANQINKKPKKRANNLPQGVYITPEGKFHASIRLKHVSKHRNFDTLAEAASQRLLWESEYLGEYRFVK